MSGSTLYVANGNGTVAIYNATTNAYVTTVNLPSGSVPTALAVDPTNGFVYVADGTNNRVEYFNATTCNASTTGRMLVDARCRLRWQRPGCPGRRAGRRRPLCGQRGEWGRDLGHQLEHPDGGHDHLDEPDPRNGTGVVQSIGLSPDGNEVLAVLNGLNFPGDVLATINTATNAITATVGLETGTDTMGQLVSDGTLGYVWVTDSTSGGDVLQNLNLAVSDPASQPYVTAVGGTSLGHGRRRRPLVRRPRSRPGTTRSTSPKAPAEAGSPRRSPCRRTSRRSERSAAAAGPPAPMRAATAARSPTCPPTPIRAAAMSFTTASTA